MARASHALPTVTPEQMSVDDASALTAPLLLRAVRLAGERDWSWMDRAACRETVTCPDDDVFFPPDLEEVGGNRWAAAALAAERELAALAVCERCPVRAECLAFAVEPASSGGCGAAAAGSRCCA